jgi:hypothetical protein
MHPQRRIILIVDSLFLQKRSIQITLESSPFIKEIIPLLPLFILGL